MFKLIYILEFLKILSNFWDGPGVPLPPRGRVVVGWVFKNGGGVGFGLGKSAHPPPPGVTQ